MSNTSGRPSSSVPARPAAAACAAMSRMNAPASATAKRALSTPLWRAFCRASRMEDSTQSTPVTCAAPMEAATRPMVPVPQYASMACSAPVKPASSMAWRYSTSVCTLFTW